MKKTISIQISGILFHVDDDAYEQLDQYLSSIRDHFASYPDSDEIVSDIERRIAERFSEKLKKSKQVITKHDVVSLIESMGTVEDFEEFESDAEPKAKADSSHSSSSQERMHGVRRLFRNPDDKVIAGVASGIAAYFGIDPVIVRVIFAVLTFVNGVGALAYIILWIAMPEAKTPTERVQMQGEKVTLSSLQETIDQGSRTFEDLPVFHAVSASGAIRVRVREGKPPRVVARGAKKELENIQLEVVRGELHIRRTNVRWFNFFFHGHDNLSVDVSIPELTHFSVEGASRGDLDGFSGAKLGLRSTGASTLRANTNAKHVDAHVEGASTLTLLGAGESLRMHVEGASTADASDFKMKKADLHVNGACKAEVHATDKIEGVVNGASKLWYVGTPVLAVDVTGASSAKQRGAVHHAKKSAAAATHVHTSTVHTRQSSGFFGVLKHAFMALMYGIGTVLGVVFRVIGGLMIAAASLALIVLLYFTVIFIKGGALPILGSQLALATGSPFYILLLIAVGVLILVPIIVAFMVGSSLAQMRLNFSVPGFITLIILWGVMLGGSVAAFESIQRTEGNAGPTETRTFALKDFATVRMGGTDKVRIEQGAAYSIEVQGAAEDVANVAMEVVDRVLTISHEKRVKAICLFCDEQTVSVRITMPNLESIDAMGIAKVEATGFRGDTLSIHAGEASAVRVEAEVKTMKIVTDGVSRATVMGTTEELSIRADNASRIEAAQLEAINADVVITGVSQATIQATGRISGNVQNASRLRYTGTTDADIRTDWPSSAEKLGDQETEAPNF